MNTNLFTKAPRTRSAAVRFLIVPAAVFLFGMMSARAAVPTDQALISKWLEAQKAIESWSAGFTQTRTLKALATPLKSEGHLWFSAPNRFRWELGKPPQTIAVRQPTEMLVIYPKLKRAERYPLDGTQKGQWRDVLTLLEAGFPRSREDLDSKFRVTRVTRKGDSVELTMEPLSAAARRMMPQIKIEFETDQFTLRATELQFADGSTLRNEFKDTEINPSLEPTLFQAQLPPDFKIVDPTK